MAQVKQDKYILGQSLSGQIQNIGQEIRLDLQLVPSTGVLGGSVSGTVKDISANPIAGALVKLMTSTYDPVIHAITDANGKYTIANIPSNQTYNIFSIATGKELNQNNSFSVVQGQEIVRDFTLIDDPATQLGVIAGDLLDSASTLPVNGAVVTLFSVQPNNVESLLMITYTNKYGQFTFREVPQGNYIIRISALGYHSISSSVSITSSGQIVPVTINIIPNPATSRGTVSGIITDNNNDPINNADVILYSVNTSNNKLTPIAFTTTNNNGVYLFMNVPPGTYKVKSNQVTMVDINVPEQWTYSPNFSGFSLMNNSDLYYPISTAQLQGTVKISDTGFIKGFGGGTTNSATFTVNATKAGQFLIRFIYLAGTADTTIKTIVNGTTLSNSFGVDKTNSWNAQDAQIAYITLNLIAGNNTITIYSNDNSNNTFWFTGIWINAAVPFEESQYYAKDGALDNGASIITSSGMVTGLGGPSNGSVTLTVTVPYTQIYNIYVYYATPENRDFKISINGQTGILQNFNSNSSTKLVYFTLKEGQNTIKFYNDTGAKSPDLNGIFINVYLFSRIYPLSTIQLSGSAQITDGVITGVGYKLGDITLNVTVPVTGQYILNVAYICGEVRQCNVDVNGVSTGETYTFPKTVSWDSSASMLKFITLTLTEGNNTIKIYNQY